MITSYLDGKITVKVGDLTRESTDAIVNAANSTLLGGGGVDGAIHNAAGPSILTECKRIRETEYPEGLPTGKAVITGGGELPAKYIVHTVGPIYGHEGGREAELLADCYSNSLQVVADHSLRSISFPSISTGAFGYPKTFAADVASRAIRSFLEKDTIIDDVRLVFFSIDDADIFVRHNTF